jgi:hypothetical protein
LWQVYAMKNQPDAPHKRSSMGWMTWGFFLAFSGLIVVMILNSLAPRQPGQPTTGGFQTMPSNSTLTEPTPPTR